MNRNKKEKHMNSRSLESNKSSWREKGSRFPRSLVGGLLLFYTKDKSRCVCMGEGDN